MNRLRTAWWEWLTACVPAVIFTAPPPTEPPLPLVPDTVAELESLWRGR